MFCVGWKRCRQSARLPTLNISPSKCCSTSKQLLEVEHPHIHRWCCLQTMWKKSSYKFKAHTFIRTQYQLTLKSELLQLTLNKLALCTFSVADSYRAADPVFVTRPYTEPEHNSSSIGPRTPDDLRPFHRLEVIRRTSRRGRGVCRNPHVQRNHYLFSRKCCF